MRYTLLSCLWICFQLPVLAQSQDYIFEPITSEAGITFNAVSKVVEDAYGFLWFGTASGLYYYNTHEIVSYNFDPLKEDSPPSNRILNLYQDDDEQIWVCTDQGICRFDESTHSFERITLKESDKFLNSSAVRYLQQFDSATYLIILDQHLYYFDVEEQIVRELQVAQQPQPLTYLTRGADGHIYLGTIDGKVFVNDTSLTDFRLFYQAAKSPVTALRCINGEIWIGLEEAGVEVVDQAGQPISRFKAELSGNNHISSNRIRDIVKRQNGEVWIGSAGGISVVEEGKVRNINQRLLRGLPHISVFDLYVDKNDGVWVGTWSGGLAYYSTHNYKFPHIRTRKNNENGSRSVISSFAEDKDGSIWVGVENFELEKFDPDKMTFIEPGASTESWPVSRVKSMTTDEKQQHWIGTLYEGLWSVKDNSFQRVGALSGIFSSVLATEKGIWIGTRLSGLYFYDLEQDTVIHFRAEDKTMGSISSDYIWHVFQDSKKNLWVCSDFGLSVKYRDATDFERFFYTENSNSLSRNLNYTVAEDKTGKIWIGTAGAGIDIYDPTTKTFSKFSLNKDIENAEVYCILQDLEDNIWFSTNQGIYLYYPQTNTLKNFTAQDGILGQQYHPNSGFISSAGKIFFGGGNGFNIIDPTKVKQNPLAPEVFLSKLMINNKPLDEQTPKYVDAQFPVGLRRIKLSYYQNSLTIGFISNNFIKPAGNRFRYRMKNYLDDWIETTQGKDIAFTKIPPGQYTLEVLASNNDGVWSTQPKTFHIKIAPPFWLSWYAYLIYSMLLIGGTFVVLRELRFRDKSRADRILFSEKVKFFTNVSHEFRTPLTLIISPLNSLMQRFRNDTASMDQIKVIKRNADRLLHLTNQVLDFRLIELNKLPLKRDKQDIVSLCRNVYACFEYEATAKQINCIFHSSFTSFHLQVDGTKFEKIIYNLLSNGLKYSPEKGQIILSIEQKVLDEKSYGEHFYTGHKFVGESLEIKVKDNGKGINKANIPHIFDRFFVEAEREETGIGVGLHMCQEYIQLHGGNIMVQSEEGKGTIFSVRIPIEQTIEFEEENMILQYHFDKLGTDRRHPTSRRSPLKTEKLVLYVEDNDELRRYYKNLLATKYRVLTAKNGRQALEIANEVIPDIIISDILMPRMDGLDLTTQIRKTTQTDHIPIILLTALSDKKYKIESMSKGANAFITKPVDESFLFAKIENIFRGQAHMKRKLEGLAEEQLSVFNKHDSFTEKARNIVEKNLRNPSFAVAEFAATLSMSRSSLQRKMKAEINLSPTEFIRDIRLSRAVELMKTGSYNIDEIGSLVGFNSTSYFIRSFKKKYGKTPFSFQSELKVHK